MNINKNTLIAICVIAIGGIVLYQVLFNFIFPIALLLFLLYVLKLLIKGENNEEIKDYQFIEGKSDLKRSQDAIQIEPEDEINAEVTESSEPEDEIKF